MPQKPLTEKWKNPTDKTIRFTLGGSFNATSVEHAREYVVEPGDEIEVPAELSYAIKHSPWKSQEGKEYYAGVAPQLEKVEPAPAPTKATAPAAAPAKK